jgi:hypothetical protein
LIGIQGIPGLSGPPGPAGLPGMLAMRLPQYPSLEFIALSFLYSHGLACTQHRAEGEVLFSQRGVLFWVWLT